MTYWSCDVSGLLADLRDAPASVSDWELVRRVLAVLIPGAELSSLTVSSGGRVAFRGKSPMRTAGRQYIVGQLEGYGQRREDGMHRVLLGVGKRRDESDAAFFERPFAGWVAPTPAALAAWLTGVLTCEDPFSPRRVTVAHDWTLPQREDVHGARMAVGSP